MSGIGFVGTSWSSMPRPACRQLILDRSGFYIQILRSCVGGSPSQRYPPQRGDPVAVQAGGQTSGNARSHFGRSQVSRSRQGSQVQQHHRWIPSCCLEASPKDFFAAQALVCIVFVLGFLDFFFMLWWSNTIKNNT